MCTETEAKLKVDSLQEVIKKLDEISAEFLEEQLQTDYYFDDANRTLTNTDRCLRLRKQLVANERKTFLTYKGAKENDNFKKRQEIEIEIKNADSTQKLLSALGYENALTLEKKRRTWHFGGCEVALDEVPSLGSFVEIEGPDSGKIADVQRSLGLANLTHIAESYASLMEQKLRQSKA